MIEIYNADSLRWLHEYDGEPFDLILTDPPYSSGGMTRGDRASPTSAKYVRSDSVSGQALPEFEGDNRDQRSFEKWCALWLMDAWRCTKPGGQAVIFTDWRQLPSVCDAVQLGGWIWRGVIPWNKTEAARPQKGRPRAQCEYAVYATKGSHAPYNGAPCLPGFYTFSAPRERVHITERPVALAMEIAKLAPPNGLVCDPFLGSGALLEGALIAGRRVVGCELVEATCDLVRARLLAAANKSDLSAHTAGQQPLFGGGE